MHSLKRRPFVRVAAVVVVWLGLAASGFSPSPATAQTAEGKSMRPKSLAILSAQAIQAFRNGDFLRAAELFRTLVKVNPADALSWQLLGQSLAGANDPRAAKQAYQKALEVRPEGPVAAATKELLANLPPPDPRSVKVDDALTLADWLPLADEMVRQGKELYVLERNGRILGAQGEIPQIEALQDRLVRAMLAPLPLTDLDRAREVIAKVRQVKPLVPGNLTVLRYEGMACHMLSNFACAEAAYSKWMQQAAPADAERAMISRLLLQARRHTALDTGEDVAKLGVSILAMGAGDAAAVGDTRLWVQSVLPGGVGDRLGLQRGDVILQAGEGAQAAARAFQQWADTRAGATGWTLEIQRGEQALKLALAPSKEELAMKSDEAFRQYFAGECEAAIPRLQELLALKPEDPLPWLLLGLCRQAAKEDVAAREAYARAMQLGKDTKVGTEAKEKLATMPQPDPFTLKLDNGLTLGDWVSLQRENFATVKVDEVLGQTRGYLNRYGPLPALAALEKDLVQSEQDEARKEVEAALQKIRVRNAAEAEAAFPQITRLKAKKSDLPALLRLEARTCHLVQFYSCAEAAYTEWLLAVPANDPRRRQVIEALFMAQQNQPLPDIAMATGGTVKHCAECPDMVVIGPGAFEMNEFGRGATVRFDAPFAIGRTEVTQAQWRRLMGGNPSEFQSCGADCPVENVSWNDAQEFVRRLASLTGKPYRLPSEAEWEAACRAGEDSDYCGGSEPREVAWFGAYGHDGGNSGKTTHPVATRHPNAWGIYDMSGNVREWVADSWRADLALLPPNGHAREDAAPRKVVKGGSWVSRPSELKSGYRDWDMATDRYYFTGFRVAVTLDKGR